VSDLPDRTTIVVGTKRGRGGGISTAVAEAVTEERKGSTVTSARTAVGVTTLTMLGLAAASWAVAVQEMKGMYMGVRTELGSFSFFVAAGCR
jgi:hypothetical protein